MATQYQTGASRYKGLTKRKYKKMYGSSTPGSQKTECNLATGLDKAMAKYPRSWKTHPEEYINFNRKKDRASGRTNTFFTKL